MSKGTKHSKAGGDAEKDAFFMKNVRYYCKGRGCRHKGEPDYKPTALCFYMLGGGHVSHQEVYERLDAMLHVHAGAKIEGVQFVPLGVHLDSPGSEDRWVITLNTVGARNRLSGTTLHLKGQKVVLRRFDDIIHLEYRKCSRSTDARCLVSKFASHEIPTNTAKAEK